MSCESLKHPSRFKPSITKKKETRTSDTKTSFIDINGAIQMSSEVI